MLPISTLIRPTSPLPLVRMAVLDLSRNELLAGFSDAESELSELEINNLAVSSGSISGDAANGWTYYPRGRLQR